VNTQKFIETKKLDPRDRIDGYIQADQRVKITKIVTQVGYQDSNNQLIVVEVDVGNGKLEKLHLVLTPHISAFLLRLLAANIEGLNGS